MDISIDVLGQQNVTLDGAPVSTLAPRERRLLSLLASDPGQGLSREWLATGLWGSCDAANLRVLQVHVSHLRASLGRATIESIGHGRAAEGPRGVDPRCQRCRAGGGATTPGPRCPGCRSRRRPASAPWRATRVRRADGRGLSFWGASARLTSSADHSHASRVAALRSPRAYDHRRRRARGCCCAHARAPR